MKNQLGSLVCCCALLLAHAAGAVDATASDASPKAAGKESLVLLMGGVGGVYFLAEPGELEIEIEKQDLNRRDTRTELRAILAGPDRRVLQEKIILDDGQSRGNPGPIQRARLSARVDARGVYALNITVSRDRYGEEVVWGFRSNCKQYLIETARGHRDRAHEEPIVLASPDRAANICFLPRTGAFRIEVAGLRTATEAPQVFDAAGSRLAALEIAETGRASHTFAAGARNATPWRLHLPSASATVEIDGLTRWDGSDLHPNLTCWTPELSSWFSLLDHRWLLTPYSRHVYGEPEAQREISFQVHNNSGKEKVVQLAAEFPGAEWPVQLSAERVALGPKQQTTVAASFRMPPRGESREARVRVTPLDDPGFTTYSTLRAIAGTAPAAKPIPMPIVLKPYEHEHEQFGYLPDRMESQVYFDRRNRPFMVTDAGVVSWRNGNWAASSFSTNVVAESLAAEGKSFSAATSKVAFDSENGVYVLATSGATAALLYSTNGGQSFVAYPIPGKSGAFDIEQFSGHNVPAGPPPFLRYTQTAQDDKLFWRRINTLELFVPRKEGDRLVIGDPILISDKCIGLSAHSGTPSSVVSKGNKVHVAWGEATDPQAKIPGVPTYVATCDTETGHLGKPVLVGHGAPANDVHNSPSITMDGEGYLHVLAGTHGRPFPYARSIETNDAHGGWTEPAPAGQNLNQTYIGLVCGPDGTLHCVFRLWQFGIEPFPASTHATLAYQRKRPGDSWEPPRVLVVSPFSEYSIFYHRLTIDRKGRLFLSYDYWSTFWFYRNDVLARQRTLLMSPDGGKTWKLAETSDFE